MVILAGGLGTRVKNISNNIPKSMITICSKSFLQYQIELLRENGIIKILLCIGYLGYIIKDYFEKGENFGVEICYSDEGDDLMGTGGALKNAEDFIEDNFFLMWGDSYLLLDYQDIWKTFTKKKCDGLMAAYKNCNEKFKSNILIKNDKITLYDKWGTNPEMVYIDNGVYVFKKAILDELPAGKNYAIEKVFMKWSLEGKLFSYKTNQCFYEIGSTTGLQDFTNLISK